MREMDNTNATKANVNVFTDTHNKYIEHIKQQKQA